MKVRKLKELFLYCGVEFPKEKVKEFLDMKDEQKVNFNRSYVLIKLDEEYILEKRRKRLWFDDRVTSKKGEVLGHARLSKDEDGFSIDVVVTYKKGVGHGKILMSLIEQYAKSKGVNRIELYFDRSCISYAANFYAGLGYVEMEDNVERLEVVDNKTVLKENYNSAGLYKNI